MVHGNRQRDVSQRPRTIQNNFSRMRANRINDEVRGPARFRLDFGIPARRRPSLLRIRRVRIERTMPGKVRTEQLLANFLLALTVKEWLLRALDDWNVSAARDLSGPERERGRGFNPLVATDRRDAEQIHLRRTKQHQQREE